MVLFAKPEGSGKIVEQTTPEAIRYLLITSFVATNSKMFKDNYNNDAFYEESMKIIREWVTCTDQQLKEKYPKLPMKV